MIENALEIEDVYRMSQAVANFKQMLERIPGLNFELSMSLFHAKENNRKGTAMNLKKGSHSPFIELKIDSCSINLKEPIRKSTARCESDLISYLRQRVQVTNTESSLHDGLSNVNSKTEIGELCVFRWNAGCEWRIGKFSKFKCKQLKGQEYKATFAEVKMKDIGML